MPITSINITRTSFNMRTISLLDSLRRNTLRLFLEQNRIATGNKFNAPSEDPVGASRAVRLSEVLERQEQILANIRHADSFLAATDSAIAEVNDLLIEAHSIASEMVSSTADQAQRDSMAELILGIINQLVSVGNRTYDGVHLFGGQQTTSPPFAQDYGGVEYLGDTRMLTTHVDFGQDPQINLTGAELFGALSSQVFGCVDLDPVLTEDTRLADLKGAAGLGVQLGLIRVSLDSPETTFVVDLTEADTVGDLIDMINAAAGEAGLTVGAGDQFNAAINAGGDGLEITVSGGAVTVSEVGDNGKTARDLGILGGGGATIDGGDLGPRLTAMTTIDMLFGGAGAVLESIRIENGSLAQTIDLSGAATVQEVLNLINAAGVQVQAKINAAATGIDVVNLMSGSEMHISEAGGTTADLLGIRSLHGQTLLSELNHGRGVRITDGQADFRILAKDGSTVDVNLDGAAAIQDVLDAINAAAAAAGVALTASLATTGNGIRIEDATGGAGWLAVERLNYSAAIDDLGLNKSADSQAATELIGDDPNGIEPDSVFSALIALHAALVGGGESAEQRITLAAERINRFIDQTNRLQGVIGARSKAMSTRLEHTEDAVVATRALLSEAKDLDYNEGITRFQQAQMTLQANLMTASRMLQLSLLDYL